MVQHANVKFMLNIGNPPIDSNAWGERTFTILNGAYSANKLILVDRKVNQNLKDLFRYHIWKTNFLVST